MPSVGTRRQSIRLDPDLWDRFGELAQPDRSSVLREFVRWYVGEKNARIPRPPKT